MRPDVACVRWRDRCALLRRLSRQRFKVADRIAISARIEVLTLGAEGINLLNFYLAQPGCEELPGMYRCVCVRCLERVRAGRTLNFIRIESEQFQG